MSANIERSGSAQVSGDTALVEVIDRSVGRPLELCCAALVLVLLEKHVGKLVRGALSVKAIYFALALILPLACPFAQAEGVGREEAVQALITADAPARRDAAGRLGEVGTMADAPALVNALRDDDEDVRARAEQALWRIWARSGDREVDRLYQIGIAQMSAGELRQSIATFTRIIEVKPDFAEGWNKRATLYFLVGDLRKSLADCDEVMKRNPYHFGALAGYAQIHARLENYERALEYSRRALKVNPNMDGVIRNIDLLERLLEQRRRQVI